MTRKAVKQENFKNNKMVFIEKAKYLNTKETLEVLGEAICDFYTGVKCMFNVSNVS